MDRRRARRLRPALDLLEGRVALSSLPTAPATVVRTIGNALPVLTTTTYHRVMRQVDWAFAEYEGQHKALNGTVNTLANVASALVSAAIAPGTSTDPNSNPSDPSTDVVTDGQGDGVALESRLRRAVDQLPYGNARVVPQILRVWVGGGGAMTPDNAALYRDRFKAMVRHYVAGGLDGHQFTWFGGGADRPTERPAKPS